MERPDYTPPNWTLGELMACVGWISAALGMFSYVWRHTPLDNPTHEQMTLVAVAYFGGAAATGLAIGTIVGSQVTCAMICIGLAILAQMS